MANVKAYREASMISNEHMRVEIEYDFAQDAGAVGALNLLKVKEASVMLDAYTKIKTAFTSGGSATLIIGVTGDTDAILASTAVAALLVGIVLPGAAACKQIKMAANDVVSMTIGTAAMTAGKMSVVMILAKF